MGDVEVRVLAKKDSRIDFVRLMAEEEEEDRQFLIASIGESLHSILEVASESSTNDETKANASSHRGAKSTEVVCSSRRQIAERIFVARRAISSVERKAEKEVVREVRIVGLNFSLKANSR